MTGESSKTRSGEVRRFALRGEVRPDPPDIRVLPRRTSAEAAAMRQLTDLINRVYAVAEDGMWLPGTTRTTVEEITGLAGAGELVVARIDGDVVGVIHVRRLDADTAETGMLAVEPAHRNRGIGGALRRFVFDLLQRQGVGWLQIELLVPRGRTQPSKELMSSWNARAGYEIVGKGAFEDQYPDLAPRLAVPCDYVVYRRKL